MSEQKKYGAMKFGREDLPGRTAQEIADNGNEKTYVGELARDLLAAQARVKELEQKVARLETVTLDYWATYGAVSEGAGARRIAELESTIARVRELPASWRDINSGCGCAECTPTNRACGVCADDLESALAAPDGKVT